MDFENYRIALTLRSICLAERLLNKPFDRFEDSDALQIIYCTLVANNDLKITYETFLSVVSKNIKIAKWVTREYEKLSIYMEQFNHTEIMKSESMTKSKSDDEEMYMSILVANLIIKYKMDAHYVMDEMQLWEVSSLMEVADATTREEWEKERLFAYLTMSPHINTKKVRKPEQILPLPWDKTDKEKAEKKMDKDKDLIKMILGSKKKKEENTDGKIGLDINNRQEGLGTDREGVAETE